LWAYDLDSSKAARLIVEYTVIGAGIDNWELNISGLGQVYAMATINGVVLAGGTGGKIWGSSDGGESWAVVASNLGGTIIMSIYDAGGGTVWAGGNNGDIFKSADYGLTWKTHDSTTAPGTVRQFLDVNDVLRAGSDGEILKLDNTSVVELGQAATYNNDVFLSNHHKEANLTTIFVDDGGVYTSIFPIVSGGFPKALLPSTPAVDDAVYFGIDTTPSDTGPFSSLVLDIGTVAVSTTSYTIVWEYWNGSTWGTLTVKDGTEQLSQPGVNAVAWALPNDWTTRGVNGTTGYWIRARVSALSGTLTPPTVQNRNPYSSNMACAEISAIEATGSMSALLKLNVNNRSAAGGPGGSAPTLYSNGYMIGLKRVTDQENFRAFINFADEQNPEGIDIDVSVDTDSASSLASPGAGVWMPHAVDRHAFFDASSATLNTMSDRVAVNISTTLASHYYGTYRVFLRARQSGGAAGDIKLRIKTVFGSGGATQISDRAVLRSVTTDMELIEFKQAITLPINDLIPSSEVADKAQIIVQIETSSSSADLYLFDLFLLPVDLAYIIASDLANSSASPVADDNRLMVDSITIPRIPIRGMNQDIATGQNIASWRVDSSGPWALPPEEKIRIWMLSYATLSTSDTTRVSNHEVLHSLKLFKTERDFV
jgi:hypothetical protein